MVYIDHILLPLPPQTFLLALNFPLHAPLNFVLLLMTPSLITAFHVQVVMWPSTGVCTTSQHPSLPPWQT